MKTLSSWAVDRGIFLDEAEKIRARFDAERGCSPAKAARLIKVRLTHEVQFVIWVNHEYSNVFFFVKSQFLQEAKAELHEFSHPDPYCVPFMPGGSLFMRNPPLPMEVCFPNGNYPADAPKIEFNPDMSVCKKETGKSAVGTVLVDFGKKNME